MSSDEPTAEEMSSYRRGTLAMARFEALDHWLDLGAYTRRLRALGREARWAIVPVHDIGRSTHGEPAYVMERLLGTRMNGSSQRFVVP